MKISVVIPAFNEENYIGKTLQSIRSLELNGHELEILVIDGDSTDRTAEIAKSFKATVKHEPHKGIGFARQHGLMHATGEIVAFTDADTVVPKNWLLKHLEALSQQEVSFSYGTFRVTDGKFPYFYYINYLQPLWIWLAYYLWGKPLAAGQNMAFWRKKALKIGGFDEKINVLEDIDFAIRMKKVGKVVLSPDIIVRSSGRRSKEGWGFFLRMFNDSYKYFFLRQRNLGGFKDYR